MAADDVPEPAMTKAAHSAPICFSISREPDLRVSSGQYAKFLAHRSEQYYNTEFGIMVSSMMCCSVSGKVELPVILP
ncbi:hypothetical protein MY3296_003587 [Beauveria thailandica]